MTSDKSSRKEKNQNIQVFVRLRPLNQREKDIKSLGVVEVVNNREVVVRQSHQTSLTKKFTFDRAFAPHSKQVEVYQDVVSPLIEEVLAGYNCTVFAYGQTGTGKTHTMVGEHSGNETTWQNDPLAGIIPRALSQLFDELRLTNTEYTVRVSYLELYNEELFDLLSTSDDNSKLRIYEDVTRKGSNIVNGLEEITVFNKTQVYKIMAQGQERKRVASTLMNAQSSRSHTVFTIVVHMKENSPEGEELVKIGKLNLVDLAGSENISKAGSDNPAKRERARECVNINQSLLTLGRVITALVERHPHIPYRESKLTRILQESLGGRTKTSIIATISPGHKDLEETMSTLEYAHRAKNIQNKPEINQKMTKKAIMKEYSEEIDRLKRDLQAARDKNGIYLANETYTEMTLKQEEQRKEIQELLLQKRAVEEEREKMDGVFKELSLTLEMREAELQSTSKSLEVTKKSLDSTKNLLQTTKLHYEEQKHLVSVHVDTEKQLSGQAQQVLKTAEGATNDLTRLHDTVDRRRTIESTNLELTRAFRQHLSEQRDQLIDDVDQLTDSVVTSLNCLQQDGESHSNETIKYQEQNKNIIGSLVEGIVQAMTEMKSLIETTNQELASQTTNKRGELNKTIQEHSESVSQLLNKFVTAVGDSYHHAESSGEEGRQTMNTFVDQWYKSSVSRVTSLRSSEKQFVQQIRDNEEKRMNAVQKRREGRLANIDRRNDMLQKCIDEIKQEKDQIQQRLNEQMQDLETEKQESIERIEKWAENEIERIKRHVQEQKQHTEERISKKISDIEGEKRVLEERIESRIQQQKEILGRGSVEVEFEEDSLEEYGSGVEESRRHVDKFSKVFDDGASAVSVDMEVFSKNVVEIVEHINSKMLDTLKQAKSTVESGANELVQSDREHSQKFTKDTEVILEGIVDSTKQTMETFIANAESNNKTTIDELTSILKTSEEQIESENKHATTQKDGLAKLDETVRGYKEKLTGEVARNAAIEGKYLSSEYMVYNPTGKTPLRQEYKLPRSFAATSPHERILARFRAMRQDSSDDDCIVIENDSELERQNSETSVTQSMISEDSVIFAAPSPPEEKRERGVLIKCTSETDIYSMRKQKGKENTNLERSQSTHKSVSRLPTPASHKKVLTERSAS